MSFNGQPVQGSTSGQYQFQSGRGGGSSHFVFNGMPQNFVQAGFDPSQFNMQMNAAMQAQQAAAQYYDKYGEELDVEEENDLDENGEPVPSPEEVRQIINSINSFKYEEKAQSSPVSRGGSKKPSDSASERCRESCAICLDDMKTGQMVKALRCSHKFHEKCINNWLRQKLLCPLCKEKVTLNQQ